MTENKAQKRWLITGCSSGFGRALSEVALARGDKVAVTARNPATISDFAERYGDKALILKLDVTKQSDADTAIASACDAFGGIDVLVNNAGYGVQGSFEDIPDDMMRAQFDVNFFGAANMIRAALPSMRAQKGGHIINITSVAGRLSAPMVATYSATKFALEGLSIGLAAEIAPFGVRVTTIEPGAFSTDFGTRSLVTPETSAPYEPAAKATKEALANMTWGDPADAARVIAAVADSDTPPSQLVLGEDAYTFVKGFMDRQLQELEAWRAQSIAASTR